MQSKSEIRAGVPPQQSSAPSGELKPVVFPWGPHFWNVPSDISLSLRAVEFEGATAPYLLSVEEFDGVIVKAERLCVEFDPTFAKQLSVICWAKRCLDKRHLLSISHEREWILRIKRAARLALKTMREAGKDPVLYFPNKLPMYQKAFDD